MVKSAAVCETEMCAPATPRAPPAPRHATPLPRMPAPAQNATKFTENTTQNKHCTVSLPSKYKNVFGSLHKLSGCRQGYRLLAVRHRPAAPNTPLPGQVPQMAQLWLLASQAACLPQAQVLASLPCQAAWLSGNGRQCLLPSSPKVAGEEVMCKVVRRRAVSEGREAGSEDVLRCMICRQRMPRCAGRRWRRKAVPPSLLIEGGIHPSVGRVAAKARPTCYFSYYKDIMRRRRRKAEDTQVSYHCYFTAHFLSFLLFFLPPKTMSNVLVVKREGEESLEIDRERTETVRGGRGGEEVSKRSKMPSSPCRLVPACLPGPSSFLPFMLSPSSFLFLQCSSSLT